MKRLRPLLLLWLTSGLACATAPPAADPSDEVAAWQAFCDELSKTGSAMLRDNPLPYEIDRAEGVLYLAQQISAAVEFVLQQEQPHLPLLRISATNLNKWGLDGADAKYLGTPLAPDGRYLLSGTLGNAKLIALQLSTLKVKYQAFASLSNADLAPAADGHFEVLIAAERGDWQGAFLPFDPQADSLIVREYFEDWENDRVSEMVIQRLDPVAPPPAPDVAKASEMLRRMSDFYAVRAPMWVGRSQQMRRTLLNRFYAGESGEQGLAGNVYGNGWYRLAEGEVALIELEEPDALLWSFQLGNYWWESLDYTAHTASLNGSQIHVDPDGRARIVVALEDPGVPNWLDPVGHPEGYILFRFQQTKTRPEPTLRMLPASELRAHMPAGTPRVSADQRAAEIAVRKAHGARRWAP